MLNPSYDSFSNTIAPLEENTSSTIEKKMEVEVEVQLIYEDILAKGSDQIPVLNRRAHLMYVHGFMMHPLPGMFDKLDASKTWISYWLMNSASLLGGKLSIKESIEASNLLSTIVDTTITICEDHTGFGGGPFQLAHLAASYAAFMTMALTENKKLWSSIDKGKVKSWLLSRKSPNGSFSMHEGGETDTRAVYCALCIASLLNLLDDDILDGVADWLIACQTYEGGFGGEPGDEAHGGYTFCALAALFIIMKPEELVNKLKHFDNLIKWTVDRQYSLEGGFSGRSNKLVDGCYSHWIGGTIALLEMITNLNGDTNKYAPLIDRQRLLNYIICCCQDRMGLRDKPSCKSDFYHTNYVLCGLSMAQHFQVYDSETASLLGNAFSSRPIEISDSEVVDVQNANKVKGLHPIFGLPYDVAYKMKAHFSQ
ncbi:hypothetical protein CANINC_001649 [Pichia inconspicua]|uniref:Protein farnesyltransferase subunit beta n=1 Tax=Pichia inconspicua TaxID=52247 RepID=A0A4T0X326_9ASCO|nr:hypothetical protein CANINC_001649 [[Candida] inconspicua]